MASIALNLWYQPCCMHNINGVDYIVSIVLHSRSCITLLAHGIIARYYCMILLHDIIAWYYK